MKVSRLYLIAVVLAAIIIIGAGVWYWQTYLVPVPPSYIKIGIHGPMTGPVAVVGEEYKRAATLAAEEINAKGGLLGMNITLVYGDDESKPEVGVSAIERLITVDKVDLLIGGLHSSVTLAEMDVIAKYRIPSIVCGALSEEVPKKVLSDPKKFESFFKNTMNSSAVAVAFADFLVDFVKEGYFKPKTYTYAMIVEDTDYGRSFAKDTEKWLSKIGWTSATTEVVEVGRADFYPELTKIKAMDPDFLFHCLTSASSAAALRKQYYELKLPTLFLGYYIESYPEFTELAGEAADYHLWLMDIGMVPGPKKKDFEGRFYAMWGRYPSGDAGIVYDAMMIMFNAVKKAGSLDKEKIIAALKETVYEGLCGRHVFTEAHESMAGPDYVPQSVYQIMGGRHYFIWPFKYKEKDFEMPPWLKEKYG